MYLGSMSGIGNTLSKITGDIVAAGQKGAEKSGAEARAATAQMILIAELLAGFAALVALAAGIFVVRGIALPIGRITKSMRDLAAGDTASTIPFAGRGDEIGAMAALSRSSGRPPSPTRRWSARPKRRVSEPKPNGLRLSASRGQCRRALRYCDLRSGSRARPACPGRSRFPDRGFAPDFEQLRHDFNKSVRQLSETLAEISNAVGAVESGSHEIASGANDLSRRTEQQARLAGRDPMRPRRDHRQCQQFRPPHRGGAPIAGRANQSALTSSKVVADADGRHAPHRGILEADLQHHRRHRRDCLPDQPSGAECRRGSRPRRRCRQGLRGSWHRKCASLPAARPMRPRKSRL